MRLVCSILFSFVIVSASPVHVLAASVGVPQVGEWVLGNYQGRGYWYPGVVAGVRNDGVPLQYDDGDVEFSPFKRLRPYDWRVGSRVECNYQSAGQWYSGTIAKVGSTSLSINYDDGDFERTRTGMCRSR